MSVPGDNPPSEEATALLVASSELLCNSSSSMEGVVMSSSGDLPCARLDPVDCDRVIIALETGCCKLEAMGNGLPGCKWLNIGLESISISSFYSFSSVLFFLCFSNCFESKIDDCDLTLPQNVRTSYSLCLALMSLVQIFN